MRIPDLGVDDRRNMETWRLATLAVDPQRASEAERFCRSLLDADPPHCQALLWALVRGWRLSPKRHVEALAQRAHAKEASVLEWLTLVALQQRMGHSDRALNFLNLGRPSFEATGNEPIWRFWRTQLLIADNREGDAAAELASKGVGGSDSAGALLHLAAARKSGDYKEYVDYCSRVFTASNDGSHLLEACQVLAQHGEWALLLRQVEFSDVRCHR
jgi:hypothetical protein